METIRWSRCFLCLSEHSEEALVRKEDVVKAFETSCQYLIDKDEVREGLLQLFEDDQGKTEGLEVVLCGSCGEVAESVQELHVELEEIRRRLLGRVKVLQDIVVRNSRLYGTNGRAKKSLEELEEWVEAQEKLGRRSVGAEKRFLKRLHAFQTLVFEKDFCMQPPTINAIKEISLEAEKSVADLNETEIKAEVDHDSISSEEELDYNEVPEEVMVDEKDLEDVPSPPSSNNSKGDGGSVSSEEWIPSDDSLVAKKSQKKTFCDPKRTSRRGKYILSNTDLKNEERSILTEAQLLALDLRKLRRFRPEKYKQFTCTTKKCSSSVRGPPNFERHLREEHEISEKNFSCPDCRHGFTTKDMFDIHLLFHCGLLTVSCHLCSVAMAPKDMKDHLESTHKLESLHHCKFCRMCFGHYIGLVDHLASHGMISFSCVECGNKDSTFTHPEYVQHLFQAHGNGDARTSSVVHPCDFPNCTSFCLKLGDLNRHKRTHFKCTHCGTECNTPKRLEVHLRTEHEIGVKPFSCDSCDEIFLRKGNLDRHKAKGHVFLRKFKCDLCPKKYALEASLQDHKAQVHGIGVATTHECEVCHKVFSAKSSLTHHLVTHEEGKKHICDKCGYSTNYLHAFKTHLQSHEGGLNYFCSHCPKAFCTQRQLYNHLRYHSDPGDKLSCDLCDFVGLTRNSIYNHKKTVHGPPTMLPPDSDDPNVRHECSTCHAKFTTKDSYFNHLAAEHDEKPFACKDCEATFSTRASLQKHYTDHHKESPGDFQCPQCPKQLPTKRGLSLHIERCHSTSSTKPSFQCDFCPSTFSHRVSLRFHKRTKHGLATVKRDGNTYDTKIRGPPYICPHCDKNCGTYSKLWNHLPVHSKEKFVCDKCPAAFNRKTSLHLHQRGKHYEGSESGKKFKCETCGLESTHLLSFRLHLKSHDEAAKIFECDKCPKKFAQKRLLLSHLDSHSTVNRHRCEVCALTFRHAASLWDHKRKKHNSS